MARGSHDVHRGWWVVALVVLMLLAGCQDVSSSSTARERPSHRASTPDSPHPHPSQRHPLHQDRAALDRLVIRPRPVGTEGYDRDAFGSDWVDTDDNGCNQRDDVLLRDAVPGTTRVQQQGACDHDVLAGTWRDPYTGHTLRFTDLKNLSQAEAIQIDHVVPLAEAWVSGARGWSSDRRKVFANDLDELLAVDGPTNASKGDDDPAAWRPRKGYQCAYAKHWITVKLRYRLAVDPSEKAALEQMLGYCP
jgi:Protein of unknown function (DUF1524)